LIIPDTILNRPSNPSCSHTPPTSIYTLSLHDALPICLHSASTTRDYLFLTMLAFTNVLAAAILTVDTLFLVAFLIFLVLAVSTFVVLEMRRSAEGACVAPLEPGTPPARRLNRALGLTSAPNDMSELLTDAGYLLFFSSFCTRYF